MLELSGRSPINHMYSGECLESGSSSTKILVLRLNFVRSDSRDTDSGSVPAMQGRRIS